MPTFDRLEIAQVEPLFKAEKKKEQFQILLDKIIKNVKVEGGRVTYVRETEEVDILQPNQPIIISYNLEDFGGRGFTQMPAIEVLIDVPFGRIGHPDDYEELDEKDWPVSVKQEEADLFSQQVMLEIYKLAVQCGGVITDFEEVLSTEIHDKDDDNNPDIKYLNRTFVVSFPPNMPKEGDRTLLNLLKSQPEA